MIADDLGMTNQRRVKALRRRVDRERRISTKQRVRFSEELKRDVLTLLAESECGRERLAREIGLAPSVLGRWVARARPRGRSRRSSARLARVKVVTDRPTERTETLELELGCGATVRGLTLEQLARLLEVGS